MKYEIGVKTESLPIYSLVPDYFDNADTEEEEDGSRGKKRGLWPLPGGINSYVETLFTMLDAVAAGTMTKTDYVRWLMATFEQVRSEKTANGYVNVPRSIGLTTVVEGKIRLTPDGERVRESKDRDILFGILAKNILGIDEIMEFLKTTQEPQTEANVLAFLKENLGVEWTTFAQVNFRLMWLVNLRRVQRLEGGYKLV